jgi:hypothetical protein
MKVAAASPTWCAEPVLSKLQAMEQRRDMPSEMRLLQQAQRAANSGAPPIRCSAPPEDSSRVAKVVRTAATSLRSSVKRKRA